MSRAEDVVNHTDSSMMFHGLKISIDGYFASFVWMRAIVIKFLPQIRPGTCQQRSEI